MKRISKGDVISPGMDMLNRIGIIMLLVKNKEKTSSMPKASVKYKHIFLLLSFLSMISRIDVLTFFLYVVVLASTKNILIHS